MFLELRLGVVQPKMRLQDQLMEGLSSLIKDFGPYFKDRQNQCWSM